MTRSELKTVRAAIEANMPHWNSLNPEQRQQFVADVCKHGAARNDPDDDGEDNSAILAMQAFTKTSREMLGELARLQKASKEHEAWQRDVEKHLAELMNPNRPGAGFDLGGGGPSIGELFCKSEEYRNTFEGKSLNTMDRHAQAGFAVGHILKAITSATAVPDRTRLPGIVPATPQWNTFVFQRLAQGQMTGGALEYVQDTSSPIDHTVAPTAEGALKPSVDHTFELLQCRPKTIAHWTEASKQILADAAALGPYLNVVLLYGLMLKVEYQVLHGDGTGENMNGIYAQAADLGAAVPGEQKIDRLARSVAVVNAQGFLCDFVAVNPVDAVDLQLTKDDTGRYLWGTPQSGTPPVLWGTTLVQSPLIPATKFLVGAGQQAAQLFEREGAQVLAGFQNDNFTKNLVTLLAELRADLATYFPLAFRKGTL